MYYGEKKDLEGMFRALEFIPRAYDIGKNILPGLIFAVRSSGMKLFHIAGSKEIAKKYPGYKKTLELAGEEQPVEQIKSDRLLEKLKQFKLDKSYPGKNNMDSYNKGCAAADFDPNTTPLDDEEIILDERQLLAVCRKYGINHLIYVGFNINWCILFTGGGMIYMSRNGLLCSTVRQAVTAVENRETARDGTAKEVALWMTAAGFGFVYDLEDLIRSLPVSRK
jgi:hypothetical protein